MEKIYCTICESAWIETTEKNVFYCCAMCRENNTDRDIQPNNFNQDLVTDYSN